MSEEGPVTALPPRSAEAILNQALRGAGMSEFTGTLDWPEPRSTTYSDIEPGYYTSETLPPISGEAKAILDRALKNAVRRIVAPMDPNDPYPHLFRLPLLPDKFQ